MEADSNIIQLINLECVGGPLCATTIVWPEGEETQQIKYYSGGHALYKKDSDTTAVYVSG